MLVDVSLVQSLTKSKAKKQPPQPKPKPTEMKQLLQLAVVRSRAGGRGPNSGRRLSEFVDISLDSSLLEARVIETAVQVLAPNEAKGLHNAAHHPEHGAVTYMQEVTEGGFSVFVGDPKKLEERYFGVRAASSQLARLPGQMLRPHCCAGRYLGCVRRLGWTWARLASVSVDSTRLRFHR